MSDARRCSKCGTADLTEGEFRAGVCYDCQRLDRATADLRRRLAQAEERVKALKKALADMWTLRQEAANARDGARADVERLQAIVDRLRGLLLKEAREAVWEVWLAAHRNFRKPDGDQSPWILQLGAIKTAAIQGCDALKAVAEAASGPRAGRGEGEREQPMNDAQKCPEERTIDDARRSRMMSGPSNAKIFLRRIDELTEQLAQAVERWGMGA